MSEWKFKVTCNGKKYIVSFRENEKLDAYARIENIVSKFEGAEYERISDSQLPTTECSGLAITT